MTPAEWQAAERAAQSAHGLRDMGFLLPWAAHGLTDEQVDAAFGNGGRAFRVLLRLTRGRFERAERTAFRHA
jgi:hypothetical protein